MPEKLNTVFHVKNVKKLFENIFHTKKKPISKKSSIQETTLAKDPILEVKKESPPLKDSERKESMSSEEKKKKRIVVLINKKSDLKEDLSREDVKSISKDFKRIFEEEMDKLLLEKEEDS